jgi:uncharacterized spore protein YtfJ
MKTTEQPLCDEIVVGKKIRVKSKSIIPVYKVMLNTYCDLGLFIGGTIVPVVFIIVEEQRNRINSLSLYKLKGENGMIEIIKTITKKKI